MLFLASKHLLSKKRQTALTFLGILLGSGGYVVISGFFLGFQEFLLEQLINNDAHIHITPKEKTVVDHDLDESFYGSEYQHVFWTLSPLSKKGQAHIYNAEGWQRRLAFDPKVQAFSPQIVSPVLLRQGRTTAAATVVGCHPKNQTEVTNIKESMKQGNFADLDLGGNRLILGQGLLEKIGARVSQTILLSTSKAHSVPFKIVGSFSTGIKPIDDGRAFSTISSVKKISDVSSQINDIAVRLKDYSHAQETAMSWRALTEDKIESWDQINAHFLSVFKIQNTLRYIIIVIVLLVAGFGIYNVLNMTVNQKQKEIAILRAIGFETSNIINLFFLQGLILGVAGGVAGLFIGYWVCLYLQTIPFGGGPLGGAGYLHISLQSAIYVQAMVLALFSSGLASILPAWSAGKMTPIEIIRSGVE